MSVVDDFYRGEIQKYVRHYFKLHGQDVDAVTSGCLAGMGLAMIQSQGQPLNTSSFIYVASFLVPAFIFDDHMFHDQVVAGVDQCKAGVAPAAIKPKGNAGNLKQ